VSVTRVELADHVHAAFSCGPANRDGLVACATSSHARPELITVLHSLPTDKTYPGLRDLWYDLAHLPVSA
jgi:hypothetical protein